MILSSAIYCNQLHTAKIHIIFEPPKDSEEKGVQQGSKFVKERG